MTSEVVHERERARRVTYPENEVCAVRLLQFAFVTQKCAELRREASSLERRMVVPHGGDTR